jgi:hypothetical protein
MQGGVITFPNEFLSAINKGISFREVYRMAKSAL